MARPTVEHSGFLIPNGAEVIDNPRLAEFDAVDANTLGNNRWLVVDGCEVFVSGFDASTTGGLVLLPESEGSTNGLLVKVPASSVSVGAGGAQARFDLIVATREGALRAVRGVEGPDPVFPEPGEDECLLATVYCPVGAASYADYCVDKRVMAPLATMVKVSGSPTSQYVLRSTVDGITDLFNIRADGKMGWGDGADAPPHSLQFTDDTLVVSPSFKVQGTLNVTSDTTLGSSLTVNGYVTSSGHRRGTGAPSLIAGDDPGDIYTDTAGGRMFLCVANEGWKEMALGDDGVPVGTVISSFERPSIMRSKGWAPLSGAIISETEFPALFGLSVLAPYITGGTAPNRTMRTPNLDNRVLMGATSIAISALLEGGSNSLNLTLAHLPAHRHSVVVKSGGGYDPSGVALKDGQHGHDQLPGAQGKHVHNINDPGHAHNGMEGPGDSVSAVVGLVWGGRNKIDALFNDSNHTYSVEALLWTRRATTGITVSDAGSEHVHVNRDHAGHGHVLDFDPVPSHGHEVLETAVGSGDPINTTPAHIKSYMYVRS